MHRRVGVSVHADGGQRLRHARAHDGGRQAEIERAEGHVFRHAGGKHLAFGILEYQADAPAQRIEAGAVVRERRAIDQQPTTASVQQAVEVQQQRGLAAAVGAEQHRAAAARDLQRAIRQAALTIGVGVVHSVECEQRRRCGEDQGRRAGADRRPGR